MVSFGEPQRKNATGANRTQRVAVQVSNLVIRISELAPTRPILRLDDTSEIKSYPVAAARRLLGAPGASTTCRRRLRERHLRLHSSLQPAGPATTLDASAVLTSGSDGNLQGTAVFCARSSRATAERLVPMRSRSLRAQAARLAVAELLEAPVYVDDEDPSELGREMLSAVTMSEGFCSLCRRCQMRKRLERRLAKKKLEEDEASVEGAASDERSIEEIMQFIGEAAAKPRRRRRRRGKRGKAKTDVDFSKTNGSTPSEDGAGSSASGGPSRSRSGSSLGDQEVPDEALRDSVDAAPFEESTERLDYQEGELKRIDEARHDNDSLLCCRRKGLGHNHVDEISPEEEAQIEREVEEFRMRLALAPARHRPRLVIPNL